MIDIATILAALIPVAADGVRVIGRAIASKLGAGAKPIDVREWVELQDSDTRKIEAIAKLDAVAGTPSQWVVNLRASARYVAVLFLVACAIVVTLSAAFGDVPAHVLDAAGNWGAAGFFFLFGDRMNQRQRGGK